MNAHHYNTTHESGETLDLFEQQAKTQDEKILAIYARYPDLMFTPDEIAATVRVWYSTDWPITSIRRSITNLTVAGELVKTDAKKPGKYSRPTYCWKFNNQNEKGNHNDR